MTPRSIVLPTGAPMMIETDNGNVELEEIATSNSDSNSMMEYQDVSSRNDSDEHSLSSGVTPSTSNPGSNPSKQSTDESLGIAKRENVYVMTWRLVMFGVLIVTTIAVAIIVYTFVRGTERRDFENNFEVDSYKIYESLASSMSTKLEAVDFLAMVMVNSARDRNETWPFTVLPDFAPKAAKTRILSQAIALQQYMYVKEEDRTKWEEFAKENEFWVQDTIDVQREDTTFKVRNVIPDYDTNHSISIRYGTEATPEDTGPYTPTWQTYPIVTTGRTSAYNFNAIQHPTLGPGIEKVMKDHKVVIGPVLNFEDSKEEGGENKVTNWASRHVSEDTDPSEPIIRVLYPILNTSIGAITVDESNSEVVGMIASSFFWRSFLENILPFDESGLIVVFENTCNQTFTYQVNGHEAEWLGPGDLHDPEFDFLNHKLTFEEIGFYSSTNGRYGALPIDEEFCAYTVSTYPSQTMKDRHFTREPVIYTIIVVSIFVFTAVVFLGYDKLVSMRQQKVMKTAVKSTTIVSSLFPSNVRDRLLDGDNDSNAGTKAASMFQPTKTRLRTFLNDEEPTINYNKPIADLFTDTTVMFADIAGFTAWSSVREPTQVFTLLETVYGAFDTIAARRGVFKVETIGDSYVAVSGLPDPRADHAVVMAKFARDCRHQFGELCSVLESTLGPETGDLSLRIGLHSGPVTAGVLRGQKSRFQLFGDTVNTAARMESTGLINKIQVSHTTATLLKDAKKGHWLEAREDMVDAKGKGLMVTYFVEPRSLAHSTVGSIDKAFTSAKEESGGDKISSQTERLINWNIEIMERLLKKIVVRRIALGRKNGHSPSHIEWNNHKDKLFLLDEVKDVIELPEFDSKYNDHIENPDSVVLEPRVRFQLREFVTSIALTYHENPFHNFQHASHVGMSVAKLLSRIVAPDKDLENEQLHDHTYGITSDPLTQFACVFSALIHDADHPGVPNSQLVKEETELAKLYEGKSVAEQNSINIAWDILTQSKYTELRKTICETLQEEERFRQLVVNAVCATDIIDKDLKSDRNKRWQVAFSNASSTFPEREQVNRKATIVIEHLIQASDVAHTMQHWHVYIKWNERLYGEMYKAYIEGRSDADPTDTWYKGELGFFDFYIIPLAQKLSECGVFGVSSDEYLNYAIMNRNEWEKKGKDVVANYVKKYKQQESSWSVDAAKMTSQQRSLRQERNSEQAKKSGMPNKMLKDPDFSFLKALQSAQQNFVITDPSLPDHPIVYASQGFMDLTGYSSNQIIGRNCRFLQGPRTDPKAVQRIRTAIKEGTDLSVCLLNYRADGSTFWNLFFISALRDASGRITNFVGIQCEVTESYAASILKDQDEEDKDGSQDNTEA